MPHNSAHHLVHLATLSKKQQKKFVSKFVLILAVVGPLMTLPQIYNVWFKKDIDGVSLLSWAFYAFGSVIWFIYAVQRKDKALTISSFLWVLMDIAVAAGIIILG
jgi:uncharacterized protein with PQ loop repeat